MKNSFYIKCGTFLTEQGLIQAFLLFFCCIGIPTVFLLIYNYNLSEFFRNVFSSPESAIGFIIMVSAPILAFIVVIYAFIYDYFKFKKNPSAIKAISLTDEYVILHCNNSSFDKILKHNEIKHVKIDYKQASVLNPSAVKSGFKLGGYGLAASAGAGSSSNFNYEAEIIITDKNDNIYSMIIPSKFSNNPYDNFQKVKEYFKKANIKII